MKLRAILVLVIALLAFNPPALAQDGANATNVVGEYEFSGAYLDGTEPYTGVSSISGTGPIYSQTFSYNDVKPATSPAIVIGNVLVDAAGDPSCSDTIYSRHTDDGSLVGMWVDTLNGNGLGLETLVPVSKTTGFEGSYRVLGLYASGVPYDGTLEITSGKDGLYMLNYTFAADALNAESTSKSIAQASGDILGVASPQGVGVAPEQCTLYVVKFAQDGSFSASFYDKGKVGAETGKRKS